MSDADPRRPSGSPIHVNGTNRPPPDGQESPRDSGSGETTPLDANASAGQHDADGEHDLVWKGVGSPREGLGSPRDRDSEAGWGGAPSWGAGGTGASWGAAGSGGDPAGPASGAPGPTSGPEPDGWSSAGPAGASGAGVPSSSPSWRPPNESPPWSHDETRPIPEPSGAGPGWGTAPPGGARQPGRMRPSRLVAGVLAVLLLIGTGFGLGQLRDRGGESAAASSGAGIPVAVTPSQIKAGDEPVAAVAKALLPSVVQIETGQGLGSGVIYDKNGYIVTAAHVVEGTGDQVTVRLADGTKLNGRVLGTDAGTDIGVIKVDSNNLQPAALALKVQLQVGQTAVAIGSPFGLEGSVTSGVVSAVNRSLPAGRGNVFEVIQTDAPINPGNSGGALADREGRVIGINDSIQSESGGNEGVGFAVPIDIAAASASRIVQGKSTESGYLGVGGTDPTLGRAGALINEVVSGSPADKAGLQVGDLVVAINGKKVQSMDDLAAQVRLLGPDQRAELRVVRDGREQTVTATLTKRPNE